MVIIECLKGFTVFISQYYKSNKMIIHHDLSVDDCRTTCISMNKCNGFNYDWHSKNCTLLFDNFFIPSNIKTLSSHRNIAFYMKSLDECNGFYHFIISNYGMLFILIIVILPCWCYIVCKKVKNDSHIRQTMTRVSQIDNSVPPPYEERESEIIVPCTTSGTISTIETTLLLGYNEVDNDGDWENERDPVPEYTLSIQ